jgi:hypothetical protein
MDELSGQVCENCGCPENDPDCRRKLEEAEIRALAFKAWKEEATDAQ